ncbi:protein phosphatase [Ureibacillus massiliensis 4400831 = CIP 108448 = CCUG 49529]|uniref:protein-serine/threonine phosphatase n=1 Tax=Ureibacillus massiliensis 4400831 = CIP 108448 = CCUG 49529 TaxID=1211035 RepID=A0A0A3J8L3_9BACL|nr:Stp1/IreP family PP2C-type Ser/Thr phosphatase [Ureibacillus massiliensis]KGR92120.1 protein phosphatase [Ureibacillus massiliensis 4400831 = CIP 108448 = CCUG 49529]
MKVTVESDIGLKRKVNEDRAAFIERPDHYKLAILADGMGGHNAGDVASEMAIKEMEYLFKNAISKNFETLHSKKIWMLEVVKTVNEKIYKHSLLNEECQGMGTTLIAVLIDHEKCLISHIGDSRAYYFTPNEVELITRDHSYVNILVEKGEISEEEAENHPQKNVIVKALGIETRIDPDFYEITLEDNAFLLICSDGLSNKLSTEEMYAILSLEMSIEDKGKKLVQLANDSGGEDNISLILMTLGNEEV